jgi:hypothetical protein
VGTIRSQDTYACSAAVAKRSSKYRSGPRNCALPAASARLRWMSGVQWQRRDREHFLAVGVG